MKKLIISLALIGTLLIPTITASAVSKDWDMTAKIRGQLYSTDGDRSRANASTTKLLGGADNISVRVKIYARQGDINDPNSWRESKDKTSAWVGSYSYLPTWWGSGHTTIPTSDEWKWLPLYVGNM